MVPSERSVATYLGSSPFDLSCVGVRLTVEWVRQRIDARRGSTADEVGAATLAG